MADVVIGKVTDGFGVKLANALGKSYVDFRTEYYVDGEPHPRILAGYGDLRDKRVLLVYRRQQRTDRDEVTRYLHNLTRLVGALTDEDLFGAQSVDVLMPYYLLGRQDKNPKTDPDPAVRDRDKGQDVGYKSLAKDLRYKGAGRILTVDAHFRRQGEGVKTVMWKRMDRRNDTKDHQYDFIDIHCLSAIPALAQSVLPRVSDDAYIVAPDGSADDMVRDFASVTGRRVAVFDKERKDDNHVVQLGSDMDVRGRDVWIVDDILSTVNTVETARGKIKNPGNVFVVASHAVLPPEGHDRTKYLSRPNGPIRGIFTSDTIENDFIETSIIPRIVAFYTAELEAQQAPKKEVKVA